MAAVGTAGGVGGLLHMGINSARENAIGYGLTSQQGKHQIPGLQALGERVGKSSIRAGLEGKVDSPMMRKIKSYGISPGLYEGEDMGTALRAAGQAPRALAALDHGDDIKSHLQGMGIKFPEAPGVQNHFEQAAAKFKGPTPAVEAPRRGTIQAPPSFNANLAKLRPGMGMKFAPPVPGLQDPQPA
jgi:hypothetical protein